MNKGNICFFFYDIILLGDVMSLSLYFLLFIIYSIVGWCIEICYTYYYERKFVNRGFLIGPYCPIYGCGAILMVFLLKRYIDDPVVLFVMALVICSILEYSTSFIMEKIFKTRWWDYSDKKFNINGRICLETMIPFGIGGVILMYILNPFIMNVLNKLSQGTVFIISLLLFILFLTDNIISYTAITKIHISVDKLKVDSTEEITKKVRIYISKYSKFGRRLIKSFPSIKFLKRNGEVKERKTTK